VNSVSSVKITRIGISVCRQTGASLAKKGAAVFNYRNITVKNGDTHHHNKK
jgi:hypothetical protein